MAPEPGPPMSRRLAVFIAGIGIAWQLVVIALAFRHAAPLQRLGVDLGIVPPASTRLFLASYQWWPVAPLLCVGLLLLAVRRDGHSHRTMLAAAVVPLAMGLILQAWANEAIVAPIWSIIQKVG